MKKTTLSKNIATAFIFISLIFTGYPTTAASDGTKITDAEMLAVYNEVKTPYKYGVVIEPPAGNLADSPSVFMHENKWYMTYVIQDGTGYSTHIAESDDLLKWKYRGEILKRKGNRDWDAQQSAGYIALQDTQWGGSNSLMKYDGKFWLSYLGGMLEGYETDPLAIGIAHTDNPTFGGEWTRLKNPVLSASDSDARFFERLTLYKSNIIYDSTKTLGVPFVMFYNAKSESGYERIALAVSDDMLHWRRMGKNPLIDAGSGLSGDPQVVKIGDLWVMFYFGAFWQPNAFDTFACSKDLLHWRKWEGKHLVESGESFDKKFAHKPWVIKHNGIVYHFYCAVGESGRVIALATSKDMKK